jgi:hypothetical protein
MIFVCALSSLFHLFDAFSAAGAEVEQRSCKLLKRQLKIAFPAAGKGASGSNDELQNHFKK